ncbi:TetR/AcrR family transcriptional regulator [Halalkalibacter nanhaiisediminis]|uniref:TetR family transcriptional regulator n=1 Tax=Halalkalibacter nanhaiisediminis TaxID=688079 RepID=A0A562QRZ2_9BACI|nr:TetR/AcrR family transcriptional regulator [Halalkalibacter nanhaiisediminis]TWI58960.1 TetR family transcriptional regulator [Halalkalibacter nanhaiisediminis]
MSHTYTNEDEYIVETTVKDQELVKKRRAEIIDVAVQIFSEKGYHATTTKEIADAAGMNVGTMFQYVKNKQDILYLVCCHIHSLIEQALFAVTTDDTDPMNIISNDVKALYQVVDQVSDYVVLMYQETSSLDKAARSSFLRREQRLCNHLEKQIRKGIEVGSFKVKKESVSLIAEDILVQAQMWAFRRWSLSKRFSLEEYSQKRIALLKTLLQ